MHRIIPNANFKRKSFCISQLKTYTRGFSSTPATKPSTFVKANSLGVDSSPKKNPKKYKHQETFGIVFQFCESPFVPAVQCVSCQCPIAGATGAVTEKVSRCDHETPVCDCCFQKKLHVFTCRVCLNVYCKDKCRRENRCGHLTCPRCIFICQNCRKEACVTCLCWCGKCLQKTCPGCIRTCQKCQKKRCPSCTKKWARIGGGEFLCKGCNMSKFKAKVADWEQARVNKVRTCLAGYEKLKIEGQ